MVEPLDTAAIRAEISSRAHVCVNGTTAHELCDALDEARAKVIELERYDTDLAEAKRALSKRISADNGFRALHAQAQDRISAALDLCDEFGTGEYDANMTAVVTMFRRALIAAGTSGMADGVAEGEAVMDDK